jgi:hypothetical protein
VRLPHPCRARCSSDRVGKLLDVLSANDYRIQAHPTAPKPAALRVGQPQVWLKRWASPHGGDRMNMEETDYSKNQKSRKFGAIVGLCLGAGVFLSFMAGHVGRGIAAAVTSLALLLAVRSCWALRNRAWFWVAVGFLVALHLSLVLFIPWPNMFYVGMNYALVPVTALDYGLVYGCIKLLEKIMSSGRVPHICQPLADVGKSTSPLPSSTSDPDNPSAHRQ